MKTSTQRTLEEETHQTVPFKVSTASGTQSIQIGFTDQRISAHAGLALMSGFLHRIGLRQELAAALPHAPQSPNAFAPVDVALGFMAGVWCGRTSFRGWDIWPPIRSCPRCSAPRRCPASRR